MSATLSLLEPPPGLAPHRSFELRELDGAPGVFAMESTDGPLRVFVLDASVHAATYQPELSDEDASRLGITAPEDALVLLVATPHDAGIRVNLLAPIVVNATTGVGNQVILDQDLPLAAELPLAS